MKPKFVVFRLNDIVFLIIVLSVSITTIIITLSMIVRASSENSAKLAIIIDDFGLARDGVDIMLSIDEKLTCAVMPLLQHSKSDMNRAIENGHEVIIHIPLQYSYQDNQNWVGKNVVKITHSNDEIRNSIIRFVNNLPKAVGANIHMGSLGSTDKRVMKTIMETLDERGLYFLDSKTNKKSVCRPVAKEVGINFGENDVFLEANGRDRESIKSQLFRAAKIAKKTGKAFAIGHVGAEGGKVTAEVIKDNVKEIVDMGVELVYVSELID